MTNIQKALIANVYPHLDIILLEEVINATPSPEIATEILCGIYLEPEVPQMIWNDDKTRTYVMESFDKWKSNVHYHYFTPKKKSAYFPKDLDKSMITEESFDTLKVSYDGENTISRFIETGEMEKNTSYMDLEKWKKMHDKCPIDVFQMMLDEAEQNIKETSVASHVAGVVNTVV